MQQVPPAVPATPPPFEYRNEGLTVHTHAYYTIQRGKRVYSTTPLEETKKRQDTWFEFEADLFPPLMLMPDTWQRYGYTLEDVHSTYEKMDASYVWQIALMLLFGTYEPEAASAGVRPTFQSLFTFLFISRKTVFDVFVSTQGQHISKRIGSVLCHERPDHKPTLPKVAVSSATFELARSMVPARHPSFMHRVTFRQSIPFKDIQLVPVEYDVAHNLVYMVRVVRRSVYDQIPVKPRECIVTLPVVVRIDSEEYILTEEACFFASGNSVAATADASRKHRGLDKSDQPVRKKPKQS